MCIISARATVQAFPPLRGTTLADSAAPVISDCPPSLDVEGKYFAPGAEESVRQDAPMPEMKGRLIVFSGG